MLHYQKVRGENMRNKQAWKTFILAMACSGTLYSGTTIMAEHTETEVGTTQETKAVVLKEAVNQEAKEIQASEDFQIEDKDEEKCQN